MTKGENKKKAKLIKIFKGFEDKIIYTGTLRGCKKRIKESKRYRYKIEFINN